MGPEEHPVADPIPGPDEESPGHAARAMGRAREAVRAGTELLERQRGRSRSVRVALEAFERDRRFAGGLLAGGLAFKIFLWLLPFSLVVVSLLGGVASVLTLSPAEAARQSGLSAALASTVVQAVQASKRGQIYLLVIGLVLTLWAGIGVAKANALISGVCWGVEARMKANPLLRSTVFLVVVVLVLVVHQAAVRLESNLPFFADPVVIAIEMTLLAVIMVRVFLALPHAPEATWRGMVPGAVLFAVGILVTRVLTIYFFAGRLDRVDDLYGALGLASVFLAWLFIISRLFVAGVSINASVHTSRTPATP